MSSKSKQGGGNPKQVKKHVQKTLAQKQAYRQNVKAVPVEDTAPELTSRDLALSRGTDEVPQEMSVPSSAPMQQDTPFLERPAGIATLILTILGIIGTLFAAGMYIQGSRSDLTNLQDNFREHKQEAKEAFGKTEQAVQSLRTDLNTKTESFAKEVQAVRQECKDGIAESENRCDKAIGSINQRIDAAAKAPAKQSQ